MLTSIATVSISGTLDRKLAVIAEAGYQGVEIFENDLLGFDGTAADVCTVQPSSRANDVDHASPVTVPARNGRFDERE